MTGYAKARTPQSDLPRHFAGSIASFHARLLRIDEVASIQRRAPDAWSRREILGHLLDSAVNNHLRFARAAIEGGYTGPSYRQNEWVRLHGYHDTPWSQLVAWWLAANQRLAALVARLPEESLGFACRVEGDIARPLSLFIDDYLAHLEHHLAQIESAA